MRWFLLVGALSACGSNGTALLDRPVDAGTGASGRDAGGANDGAVEARGTLHVLTYNVAGLPEGISSSQPERNTPQISPLLNGFDLVFAQEDFWYHEALVSALTLPFRSEPYRTPPAADDIGDGLALFSRLPFADFARTPWGACHGQTDCASDCLATKGFAFARLTLAPGMEVDLYDLHFEAGNCAEDAAVRAGNVELLATTLAARSAARAVIVAGDFNLHEEVPEEVALLEQLLSAAGLTDACRALACTRPKIDRVLFRSGGGVALSATAWSIPEGFVDASTGESLSDHQPVAVELRYGPSR